MELTDMDVAKYFISKDRNHVFFNTENLIHKNGHTFYEGNARLNKYLHLAQNIYIAKQGEPLFSAQFYAYDNGVVSKRVQENYARMTKLHSSSDISDPDTRRFLDSIYDIFSEASVEELIELSHEDPEWQIKCGYYRLEDEKIDSMAHAAEYREQYADIVAYINRVNQ